MSSNEFPLAVCCVVRNADDSNLLLLVSRKDNLSAFGLPGGKVDPEDASPRDAIIREVKEETGLSIIPGAVVYETLCPRHAPDGQDYYALAFIAESYTGEIQTRESGIVKWGTWEDQETGIFATYNAGVRKALEKL